MSGKVTIEPEFDATFGEWLASLPPHIAEVARLVPPCVRPTPADGKERGACYRDASNPMMHYSVYSYGDFGPGLPVTLTMLHGHDSTLPGVSVFGLTPDHVVPCNCGHYMFASDDDARATSRMMMRRRGDEIIMRVHQAGPSEYARYVLHGVYDAFAQTWPDALMDPVELWRPHTLTRSVALAALAWGNESLAQREDGKDITALRGAGFQ